MKKSVPFLLLLFLLPSVLFAVSFLDGRISFNVPNALEIRSNQYEQIFSRVADDAVGTENLDDAMKKPSFESKETYEERQARRNRKARTDHSDKPSRPSVKREGTK